MKLDFIFQMFQQLYHHDLLSWRNQMITSQLNCVLADSDVVTQSPFKHLQLNVLH